MRCASGIKKLQMDGDEMAYPKLSTKACVYPEREVCNYTDKIDRCEFMKYDTSQPRGFERGTWVCIKETPLPPEPSKPPKPVLSEKEKEEKRKKRAATILANREARRAEAVKAERGISSWTSRLYICEKCGTNFLMVKDNPKMCPGCGDKGPTYINDEHRSETSYGRRDVE